MKLITSKSNIQLEDIQASIEKAFPDLKVSIQKHLIGKSIKVKRTSMAGLVITYKKDTIEIIESIPNPWVNALSRQFGLLGVLLTRQIKKSEREQLLDEVKLHLNLNF
ncbi:MAG TPA: hypothetical protein VFF27_01725 [Bacteroidia bacterium]|jgi:hypothetical protein|nr:hypothetical protein [Bacteroidia bacterium]